MTAPLITQALVVRGGSTVVGDLVHLDAAAVYIGRADVIADGTSTRLVDTVRIPRDRILVSNPDLPDVPVLHGRDCECGCGGWS